ncbi:hypothetical protein KKF84_02360 [Myxococcota bacterium]|nr:hypothetical protein [Myxococcota bacterium]MBU1534131.1 hypothetical protein [Myxococcota bacterium]
MTEQKKIYQTRQPGLLIILLTVAEVGFCLTMGFLTRAFVPFAAMGALFSLVGLLFYQLTVRVDAEAVTCIFGVGVITKRLRIRDIMRVKEVKNPWYYGFGIRKVPGGWMYNISGKGAVEFTLKEGGIFRAGTPDPQGLVSQIEARLKERAP